jgi:hypothetical protein
MTAVVIIGSWALCGVLLHELTYARPIGDRNLNGYLLAAGVSPVVALVSWQNRHLAAELKEQLNHDKRPQKVTS